MTPLIFVLAAIAVVLALVRRRRRQQQGRPSGHHRAATLLGCHQRRRAEDDARQLLAALVRGGHIDPTAHLAAGVTLQPGEIPWRTARTDLVVHTAYSTWTYSTRVS